MNDDIDKLAFSILTSLKWAVDGGKIEELPRVHEILSDALDTVFSKKLFADTDSLRTRKDSVVLDVLQRNDGNIARTAKELNVSRWTVGRCAERYIKQRVAQ
jgi:transcriptional regulator of acetoin/glycerol metabolism